MAKVQRDQAEGLRRLLERSRVRVIAVAAGCGGVGKTSVVINLAAALTARGQRVLIIDENFAPHNVAGLLGVHARSDLRQVIEGACDIETALVETAGNITLLPAASGVRAFARLQYQQQEELITIFGGLDARFDVVLINTSSGTVGSMASFSRAARDTVVVCTVAEMAITTSYALLKRAQCPRSARRYHVLLNRVADERAARVVYSNLERAADTHLQTALNFLGCIPKDACLHAAAQTFQPVVTVFPQSPSAGAFRSIAESISDWPKGHECQTGLDSFMQRLFLTPPLNFSNAGA